MEHIAYLATRALLCEAYLSPKPGLVDAFNAGSHKDMDIHLFKTSALSLQQAFFDYLTIGYQHTKPLSELLDVVRRRGLLAEKEMFLATNNVNTHKGANFNFAIFLSCIGYLLQHQNFTRENLHRTIKEVCKDLVQKDFNHMQSKDFSTLTHGEKLYVQYGYAGIREEAQLGYPNIFFHQLLTTNNIEYKYSYALLRLISTVEDGNIIYRTGFNGLSDAREIANNVLKSINEENYQQLLIEMNQQFISKNMSPGGCADLLSLLIFLDLIDMDTKDSENMIRFILGKRGFSHE